MSPSFADFDDRLNPFLVKEARQLVRSKVVAGGQWVLLLAMLVATLAVGFLTGEGDAGRHTGMVLFGIVQGVLGLVCLYGVPLYVGVRMACERVSQEGMDMLRGTSLSPQSVIFGKWCVGLFIALLACSACAPFMAACYFFRGVSVSMVLVAFACNLAMTATTTLIGLFIGSLGAGWLPKIIGAVAYLVFSPCVSCMGTGLGMAINRGGAGSAMWFIFGGFLVACLVIGAVFYGLTVVSLNTAMRTVGHAGNGVMSGWRDIAGHDSPGSAPLQSSPPPPSIQP